jgi:2-methylcitrate dehydratase PrpD
LRFEDLPAAVVRKAKDVVLDAIACQLACSQLPHGRMAIEYARRQGASPVATVLGTDLRTGVEQAALVNGIFGHGDEIDEPRHRSAVLLPAVLAAAERERASGRDLVVALVAGYDVAARLDKAGLSLDGLAPRNFQEGSVPGSVAAAAAVGRLLGLSRDELRAAMGLGAEQSCGLQAMRLESGHMNKSVHMGIGARNGLTAAYLAQVGYGSGVLTILESPYGIFDAFVPEAADADQMVHGLGTRFDILDTGFKRFSAGRPIHSAIALVLDIMAEQGLTAADLDGIVVRLPTLEHGLLSGSRTLNVNIEYCVAVAAVDGELTWEQYAEEKRQDPALRALWPRVTSRGDPELDEIKRAGLGARPAGVELTTRDGRTFAGTMLYPPGHPENPFTPAEMEDKFRRWSGRVLPAEQVSQVWEIVNDLDALPDVNELADLLRVPAASRARGR